MTNETELNIHQKIGEITLAMQGLEKDGKGYGYKYVTIDQIMAKLAPQLKQHGLSMIQTVEEDQMITQVSDGVTTIVSAIPFLTLSDGKNMNAIQALGASLTYSRRYGLSVMFGICAEEDTDGTTKFVDKKSADKKGKVDKAKKDELNGLVAKLSEDDIVAMSKVKQSQKWDLQTLEDTQKAIDYIVNNFSQKEEVVEVVEVQEELVEPVEATDV